MKALLSGLIPCLHWCWRTLGVLGGAATISLVRGSFWAVVILSCLGSTASWQYFSSTLRAHEFSQSLREARGNRSWRLPLVIGIDEDGYREFFQGSSPLPRDRILKLVQVVQAHTPPSTRIALSFPVGPEKAEDIGQQRLDSFWLEQPQRWVLPASQAGPEGESDVGSLWQRRLCALGVSFGRVDVPSEFGYPMLGHQYVDAQASVLAARTPACAKALNPKDLVAMPLLPASLEASTIVRFQGDLKSLAQMLDMFSPEVVMIGVLAGPNGILGTPMGDRYAVEIQAAALAGVWNGERLASLGARLIFAWMQVTLLWLLLSLLQPCIDRWIKPPLPDMTGHQFVVLRFKFVAVLLVIAFCLYGWVWLGTVLHAMTGLWISSDLACGITLMFTLFTWNWGRHAVSPFATPWIAWRDAVWSPLRAAWASLRQAQGPGMGFERWWAVGALLLQGLMPFLAMAYLLIALRGTPW
ncbi:MAG: CHASE2 domain-containing protein [Curvibacter sp.]|nr:MAG: CHASE2 domain-containing protein [Curvibacter sp.]